MAIQIISNISQIIKICVSINLKKYIKINDFHVSFHNLQFFFSYILRFFVCYANFTVRRAMINWGERIIWNLYTHVCHKVTHVHIEGVHMPLCRRTVRAVPFLFPTGVLTPRQTCYLGSDFICTDTQGRVDFL